MEEALSRETQRGARQRLAESEFVGTFVAPVANETGRALEAALSHVEIALDVTTGRPKSKRLLGQGVS